MYDEKGFKVEACFVCNQVTLDLHKIYVHYNLLIQDYTTVNICCKCHYQLENDIHTKYYITGCNFCGHDTLCMYGWSEGEAICYDCIDDLYVCENCDNHVEEGITVHTSRYGDQLWCHDCTHNYAFTCPNCEVVYDSEQQSGDLCDDCYNEEYYEEEEYNREYIQGYDYKPYLNFIGDNTLHPYMGVELEFIANDHNETARDILESINTRKDKIYFTEDNSLSDGGVELTTHPMTLSEHKKIWEKICTRALGSRDYIDDSCGLHVHIDKRHMDDRHKACFGFFVWKHLHKLMKFGGRSACSHSIKKDIVTRCVLDKEKVTESGSRCEALNWTNEHTVECRWPNSTLDYEAILFTLELLDAIYSLTRDFEEPSETITWLDLREYITGNFNYEYILGI